MSFAEGMNQCLRMEIPALVSGLMILATFFSNSQSIDVAQSHWFERYRSNATESISDYTMNNLLIGSPDPFFWFLVPIFAIICTGLCIAINYTVLIVTHVLMIPLSYIRLLGKSEDTRYVCCNSENNANTNKSP